MTAFRSASSRDAMAHALLIVGLSLGATLALRLLTPDPLSPELAKRLLGVLMGAVIVFYANATPKALRPLTTMRCEPRSEQATRRFVGWNLAIGGMGYALAWMFAPMESARGISMSFLGASVLIVLLRLIGKLRR